MGPAEGDMAAKVFESIGKFGLALAVAGGVVNSALYNGEALEQWVTALCWRIPIGLHSPCDTPGGSRCP